MCLFGTHGITLQEYKRKDKFERNIKIYNLIDSIIEVYLSIRSFINIYIDKGI